MYDGNTHDSRTFLDAVNSFEQYGFKEGLVVFDRGISSEPNQKEIDKMGWKVLCGLPLTSTLKRIARGVAGIAVKLRLKKWSKKAILLV